MADTALAAMSDDELRLAMRAVAEPNVFGQELTRRILDRNQLTLGKVDR